MSDNGSETLAELRGRMDALIENLRQNNVDMTNLMQKLPEWYPQVFSNNPDLDEDLRNLKERMCMRNPPGC